MKNKIKQLTVGSVLLIVFALALGSCEVIASTVGAHSDANSVALEPNGALCSGKPAEFKVLALGAGVTLPDPSDAGIDWTDALPAISQPAHVARSFINWNTKPDGTGTSYRVGTVIHVGMTLFAQWTPVWTVRFNSNGGTRTVPDESVIAGEETDITLPDGSEIKAPAHSSFRYWSTQLEGVDTCLYSGTTYTLTGDTTLYAKWTGDGLSVQHPIEVGTATELAAISSGKDKEYKLEDNITAHNWITPDKEFAGNLDGNGKTITLDGTVTASWQGTEGSSAHAGIFSSIQNGSVKNLCITGTITCSNGSDNIVYAGALAGMAYHSDISNIKSTAEVSATPSGNEDAAYAGGIVGKTYGGTITNCWTTGAVTARALGNRSAYAGGILGGVTTGSLTLRNCYATGAITATSVSGGYSSAGGIVGEVYSDCNIWYNVALNSSINNTVTREGYTGRITGNRTEGNYGNLSNWAITMPVNSISVSTGALENRNGAQFNYPTTKASWTNSPNSGPGWVIANSKNDATELAPWWWDGDHPALFWE